MGAVVPGLRVLRLVLLGGALSVLWLLLTATDSSATPAGDDRSLPLVGQVPAVRDVATTARLHEDGKSTAGPSKEQRSSAKPLSSKAVARQEVDRKAVDAVRRPAERTAATVVDAADTTLGGTERISSTVVDVAESATGVVASAPVVAPLTQPITAPVVDEVVRPVLSTTKGLTTAVVEETRGTVKGVDAVVLAPGEAVRPTIPTADGLVPVTTDVAPEPVPDEVPGERSVAHGEGAAPSAMRSAATSARGQATGWGARNGWLTTASDDAATVDTSQDAARGSSPRGVPAPSFPLGLAPGCGPGASASGGGLLDLAAYRSLIVIPVATTVPTGGSGHTVSVPGPSVLPGFSPE